MSIIEAAKQAEKQEPVAEFRGRRQTPEGTIEFWGVMLCDPMQDPPKGAKLYLGPVNDPVPADWRSVIPGGRYTDKWESARVGDFNEGWNTYRKAVITALSAAAPQPQREWVGLTRDEVDELFEDGLGFEPKWTIYQEIEAKLREKNGGGV